MSSLAGTDSRMSNSSASPQFDLTPPSEAQLKKLIDGLSGEERCVMLHHGDERPFCGVLLAEKRVNVTENVDPRRVGVRGCYRDALHVCE